MTTTARWRALRWFADHAADINAVFGRRMPSAKMRKLMMRDGQIMSSDVGSFKHRRFELTAQGRAMLAEKYKRKKPNKEEDHDEHRDGDEQQRQAADETGAGAGRREA
jgi:hypothetical protein